MGSRQPARLKYAMEHGLHPLEGQSVLGNGKVFQGLHKQHGPARLVNGPSPAQRHLWVGDPRQPNVGLS